MLLAETFDWYIIMVFCFLLFLYDNRFRSLNFLRFVDWFVPAIKTSVHAKWFFSVFHAIILRNSEAIGFESRNIVILLYQTGYLTYLSVAIAVNKPKSFHFIVDSLCCELSKRVDRFEVRCRYSSVRIDVEQIDNWDEQTFPEHHVTLRRVLFCRKGFPVQSADILRAWNIELSLRRIRIQFHGCKVATLYSKGMYHLEQAMIVNPSASLLCEIIVFVLGDHRFLRVNAVQVLEVRTVVLDHLAEYLSLYLLEKFLKSVAVNEKALSWRVSVQIEEEINTFQRLQIFFNSPNWLAEYGNSYCFLGSQ